MSHIANVESRIKELDVAEEVAPKFGGMLMRGQTSFRSYRGKTACDHALVLPNDPKAYEIGLVARADGDGWDLAYDNWGPGAALDKAFGQQAEHFRNEYMAVVVERELEKAGRRVHRDVNERQHIRLLAY